VALSLGQRAFISRSFAIAVCASALGLGVLTAAKPALAQQPEAAEPESTAGAPESEPNSEPSKSKPPTPAAPPQKRAPISPLLPGYVPGLLNAPPPLVWKWPRFSTANYLVTGAGAAITLAAAIIRPRSQHSLSGGLWFDESVRDALRVDTLPNRYIFRDASDVGLSLMVSWPFVADALTTAWWYRGSRDTAEQMALIDLETLAISGAIQGATNVLVSRERPFGRNCGTDALPSDAIDCANSAHYRSFFSGHSSFSFTSAALICTHHFKNELLGPPWDALSCAGGYALATTTATFRVVSDVHYASDILTGALMGTLVGYGVPWLHYRRGASGSTKMAGMQLHLVPSPGGLGVLGIF
jgi:membrane-associated phospholipid phosphatase